MHMLSRTEKLFLKQANLYRQQAYVDTVLKGLTACGPPFVFNEGIVKTLHKIAMTGLLPNPGEYRQEEVHITNSAHNVPSWVEVPAQMLTFCQYLQNNWATRDLVHLAAFAMWRLNWIHPFPNGNGRTARATSYLVLCAKHGQILPPKNSVLAQIMHDKVRFGGNAPYYKAIQATDGIYGQTNSLNAALQPMEELIHEMLVKQLKANFEE
jgi:Fic family protein